MTTGEIVSFIAAGRLEAAAGISRICGPMDCHLAAGRAILGDASRWPEEFRDRVATEISGPNGVPFTPQNPFKVEIRLADSEEIHRLRGARAGRKHFTCHIDQTHMIQMPYGEDVRATLRGFLDNEDQLPRVGRVGDMYVVDKVPWIWVTVPGTTAPTWVDP